ncbi:unnamed protein product [Bursaphelenchus xylophilus]|uniref:(pine wood nematode) hypothetical protein n=1 Tax=Bursaphelenchus xylophilus TaxID=6326 RepID=A0A1I7SGL8_BURXY|nr:unnamed protein product [Bursaphelenchus xylophilus]CAG9113541.1 unnamed protein product [Bursaphelenchus xylophilus]
MLKTVLLLSTFSAVTCGPLAKLQARNGLVPWWIPNDISLGPAKEAIKMCHKLGDYTPGTIHSAKNISNILEFGPIDNVTQILLGLYSENKQFKWLETEEPYDYNNIRPGVEIPDGPTFYVMAYEDTPDQKAGEWLPVDGNTEINAVLCNLFKAL